MVLSDYTIRELMGKGELILQGEPENARYGSYRFTAAKLYHGGSNGAVVDFTDARQNMHDVIEPGEYVWVRMAEEVSLPGDIIAFWWQTNHLSRKGLFIMNMSIVEPGYKGPLSCLFVNFGRLHISIHKGQSLAKLIFLQLDRNFSLVSGSDRRSVTPIGEYDQNLHNEALQLSATFLQASKEISSKFDELEEKRNAAINKIAEEKERLVQESKEEFERNVPAAIKRYGVLAAGVLTFLIIVSSVTPWIQSLFHNDFQQQVANAVRSELGQRVLLQQAISNKQSDQQQRDFLQKLQTLEARLENLETQSNP